MPKPSDWWVEYYATVGEHGSFRAKDRADAVRNARRLVRDARKDPNDLKMVEIYDYGNSVGEVFWATPAYVNLMRSRDPEGNPPQWMEALRESHRTGKSVVYDLAGWNPPTMANPISDKRMKAHSHTPAVGNPRAKPPLRGLRKEFFDSGFGAGEATAEDVLSMPETYREDPYAMEADEFDQYIAGRHESWWDTNYPPKPRGVDDQRFSDLTFDHLRGFRSGFLAVMRRDRGKRSNWLRRSRESRARANPSGPKGPLPYVADIPNEWERSSAHDRADMLRAAGFRLPESSIDKLAAMWWHRLPGQVKFALARVPKPTDPERFGVFVYGEEGGENPLVYSEYYALRGQAVGAGRALEKDARREYDFPTFVEVWEKDAEGLYGNAGTPVWASRGSGHHPRFSRNPRVEKREYTVFKFDELSKEAKEKALEAYRDINVDFPEWWDFLKDDFVEDLAKIGIDAKGAKFYWDLDRSRTFYLEKERVSDPERLRKAARVTFKMLGAKDLADWESDFAGIRVETAHHRGSYATNSIEPDTEDHLLTAYLRGMLEAFWKRLYDDYQYRTGDEAVAEAIVANDLDFSSDGKAFNQ